MLIGNAALVDMQALIIGIIIYTANAEETEADQEMRTIE
jgi:hypothetical protein